MARLYPKDLQHQLGFDVILQDLQSRCKGEPAKDRIRQMPLLQDPAIIENALARILQYQETLQESSKIYLTEYADLTQALHLVIKEGYVLELEALREIGHQINMVISWFDFFSKEKRIKYRNLYQRLQETEPLTSLKKQYLQIFNPEWEVKDSASQELARIRKSLKAKISSLDHAFDRALIQYKAQGFLADNLESFRNGRRVLAVSAEYKRKIKGIIHDQSSTGQTFFIQPEETLTLDNELVELRNEERREIRKILQSLCGHIRTMAPMVTANYFLIIDMDIIRAKAMQAIALGVLTMPSCGSDSSFEWYGAKHPLLLLKHKEDPATVIPFDIALNDQQRIVIISGPNAGGKTITLKAVGLLCLMHQSAMLTPVADQSTMGIFEKFMTDIGDHQSIEQDLSTYSSHLSNMRVFTNKANARTLFLIDEFASGTEPTIGAAIAEAILHRLNHLRARGIITTHYGNLKILASKTKGIKNGAMDFDKDALQPTFHFAIGAPGSSFAFEMAKRSGLHPKIIDQARKKIGKKEGKLDYLLTSLQREKNQMEKSLQEVEEEKKNLEKLVKNYERMSGEMEIRRKKLKLEEKSFALQQQNKANRNLEKVIREIREEQNLEKAKELATKIKSQKSTLETESNKIHHEILDKTTPVQQKPFAVGDHVKMKMGDLTGTITRIKKDKVIISSGSMNFDVKVSDLLHTRAPIEIQKQKSVNTSMQMLQKVHHKIDLRGLRKEEAYQQLEQFFDKALMANLSHLEVIHGKGNGILKQIVKDKLKDYAVPCEISHPQPEQGGDGVSIITFA